MEQQGTGRPRIVGGPPLAAIAAGLLLAGCRADGAPRPDRTTLELHALAEAPALEIGSFEGGTDASFELVTAVTPLHDGRLLVVDGGAQRISVFAPDGAFLRGWGRRGEGPGEFRSLSRAWPVSPGRVAALDAWGARLSVFDTTGAWIESVDARSFGADSTFFADVWLHRRFWIEGGRPGGDREAIRRILELLPEPSDGAGYRYVRATPGGDLWIREWTGGEETPSRWTVTGSDGDARFALELPARFTPLHVDGETVWGRWRGPADVNYVRRYTLNSTGTRIPLPNWLSTPVEPGARHEGAAETEEELLREIRGTLKHMASAQEMHYAKHGSYTRDASALDVDLPHGVTFDIVEAHDRGWTLVVGHRELDRLCGLGYGAATPPGWMGGSLMCGR